MILSVVGVYVVRISSLNDMHSCQLFRKASSLVLLSSSVSSANLSCLLATTFSSLRFLFNFTSLQSFEVDSVVFYFLIFASYPQSFFFLMIKLLYSVVQINSTGVTGQSLPPKNDFEHARGLRNSAYAVNLTYETYRHIYIYIHIYHAKSQLNTPVWGSLRSPN